jgi:hypothetical protein
VSEPMNAAAILGQLVETGGESSVEQLLGLYHALPPVDIAFMLGEWEGGAFRSGHPGEAQLVALGWVGKSFHGENDVDPIIVRDDRGQRVASPVMGKATLRMVSYRGVSTATMIYDRHPIFDHFRKLGDDRVMGVMDRKGEAAPLCFWLRRVSARADAGAR